MAGPGAPSQTYYQYNRVLEAHAVVVVDDTEVVNVTSKDTHVYEEEDECSYSEHQAGREAQHSEAVPPPHPGRSLLSSQTQELEQAVTVQSQQNPAMLGCSVGNSSVFQSEEGIGEG
ncbi:Cation channel sperm-associated auxiliary subunit TMEM262 [Apodemus speciosus]|uniref:Cation channel sperm-associated auxiliary subunit TMEM262 n=1 Tax=Apodemus speciosus TaxID=105296 RepID=A0ABQ0FSM7_APOSI